MRSPPKLSSHYMYIHHLIICCEIHIIYLPNIHERVQTNSTLVPLAYIGANFHAVGWFPHSVLGCWMAAKFWTCALYTRETSMQHTRELCAQFEFWEPRERQREVSSFHAGVINLLLATSVLERYVAPKLECAELLSTPWPITWTPSTKFNELPSWFYTRHNSTVNKNGLVIII